MAGSALWRKAPALIGAAALGAITLLGFAAPLLPPDVAEQLRAGLSAVSGEPWAPPAAILGFAVLACLGVPQAVLITALVVVFGGWVGFAYSWCGKVIACAAGFLVGRRFGTAILARHQSEAVTEFSRRLARRGFLVSAVIRLVPTVPSVLINIAAGATSIRFIDFIAGTALGSVPKMALFAFGGESMLAAMSSHSAGAWIMVALAVAAFVALGLAGRWWFRRRREEPAA